MNSLQINNILKKKLGYVFKGVYAIDQIAGLKPSAPAAYVINTKPITSLGGTLARRIHNIKSKSRVF